MASHADVLRGFFTPSWGGLREDPKNVCGGGYAGYGFSGVVRISQRVWVTLECHTHGTKQTFNTLLPLVVTAKSVKVYGL